MARNSKSFIFAVINAQDSSDDQVADLVGYIAALKTPKDRKVYLAKDADVAFGMLAEKEHDASTAAHFIALAKLVPSETENGIFKVQYAESARGEMVGIDLLVQRIRLAFSRGISKALKAANVQVEGLRNKPSTAKDKSPEKHATALCRANSRDHIKTLVKALEAALANRKTEFKAA